MRRKQISEKISERWKLRHSQEGEEGDGGGVEYINETTVIQNNVSGAVLKEEGIKNKRRVQKQNCCDSGIL